MTDKELKLLIEDTLMYYLNEVDGNDGVKWCYPLSDESGRDFYRDIPIEYLDEFHIDDLKDKVYEDANSDYEYETGAGLDWDWFCELFDNVFYSLANGNNI